MCKNIKSDFFKKILFLHLDERKLLKLLNYNKELQNLMDIKLIFYKILSGKIIIGERNGLGKELDYFTNEILFEGEYLNGKRNGKGKEYRNGKLGFEGEYLNGKRHGKGKEIFYIINYGYYLWDFQGDDLYYFEGDYLNGKRWTGFQYRDFMNGNNKRKFEIKNGNGFIREFYTYKDCPLVCIKCEYKNGEKNGKAEESYYFSGWDEPQKIVFKGEYLNGKKWNGIMNDYTDLGYGDDYNNHYELKNGKGYIIDISNECFYRGEFVNGEKNGKGEEYNEGLKLIFEGEYLNDKRYGKGKEYYRNKNLKFEGNYKYGFKVEGKEYYPNGKLLFQGKYKWGQKWDGEGYDEKCNKKYKINNGNGFINEYEYKMNYDHDDFYLIFEGEYLNGEKHGKGKEYNKKVILYSKVNFMKVKDGMEKEK